jgi:coenzyme F420 biosynthesis associated uncharacterized protein
VTEGAGLIDWGIASKLGKRLGGERAPGIDPGEAHETASEALRQALDYTTLEPARPVPEIELVSRAEWVDANLEELRLLMEPVDSRLAREAELPGPLGPIGRKALGSAAGAQAGAVIGYASSRVLGQYQVSLRADPSDPRLLLVGANLSEAAGKLDVDPRGFLFWVLVHEQTHSIQFAAVPWLREHLAGLVSRLLEATQSGVDGRALLGRLRDLVAGDPRETLRRISDGDMMRIFAGPEQAEVMDEVAAVMSVVEGYAEHVMDAACAGEPGLAEMRARMDARRAERSGLAGILARLLGLGAKLRQYELGKRWADEVAAAGGIAGLDRVWSSPEALPSLAELSDPDAWLERMAVPVSA